MKSKNCYGIFIDIPNSKISGIIRISLDKSLIFRILIVRNTKTMKTINMQTLNEKERLLTDKLRLLKVRCFLSKTIVF